MTKVSRRHVVRGRLAPQERPHRPSTSCPSPALGALHSEGEARTANYIVAMHVYFVTAASTPALLIKYSQTGVTVARAAMRKGAIPEIVRLVSKESDIVGHAHVVIKCVNRPVMKALAHRVKESRSHPTGMLARNTSPSQTGSRRGVCRW